MTQRGLAGQSIGDIQTGLAQRRFSAVEMIDDLLGRLPAFSEYNAFAIVDADGARRRAAEIDRQLHEGAKPTGLMGVPVAIKDLINTAGLRTAYASRTLEHNVPAKDAFMVSQVRKAGAIIYGKTTTPEFGHKVQTDSPLHGVTRNPWDPSRTTGGSSGGAAAAVALGLGPIALTTDGAGSSRIPASCCGVYGLKPTLGRVAHETSSDVFNLMVSLGVMARVPEDLHAGLAAMAGACIADPWTLYFPPLPQNKPTPDVAGRRFLLIRKFSNKFLMPEVEAALEDVARKLAARGAIITEFDGSKFDWSLDVARRTLRVNQLARFKTLVEERGSELDPTFIKTVMEGAEIDAVTIANDMLARTSLYHRVNQLLESSDYLLTPTTTSPAPPATQNQFEPLVIDGQPIGGLRDEWYVYTIPQNITGHPGISIPVTHDRAGLPISVHVTGRWADEAGLIDIARVLDRETGASDWLPPPLRN